MTLLEKLRADQLSARKQRDTVKAGLLTALISEAANVGKTAGNRESTEQEVQNMIRKFLKNAHETLSVLPEGDAKTKTVQEIAILDSYLPVQMTETELRVEIATFRSHNPSANLGAIMKHLKENYSGRYDGKLANTVAQSVLKG
jgi:uncharacterized protein